MINLQIPNKEFMNYAQNLKLTYLELIMSKCDEKKTDLKDAFYSIHPVEHNHLTISKTGNIEISNKLVEWVYQHLAEFCWIMSHLRRSRKCTVRKI